MVIAVASPAAFLQVLGEVCTQGVKQFGHGPGRGGDTPSFRDRKADMDRQGFPRALPFPFVHLRKAGKGDYLQVDRSDRLKAKLPWIPRTIRRKILRSTCLPPMRRLRTSRC